MNNVAESSNSFSESVILIITIIIGVKFINAPTEMNAQDMEDVIKRRLNVSAKKDGEVLLEIAPSVSIVFVDCVFKERFSLKN